MTDLTTFKFNDLLPSSVKDAPKFQAASACLDKLFDNFDERVKMMLIYSRVDELNNEQLDELAWQWNIGYYEGYSFAETLDDKRILIKNAIQLHWYKGTRWALESVPIYLGMPAFTVEWFEGDIIGSQMNPYEFDIAIDTGVRGASPTIHEDIRRLVNNLKNIRSYFRHIILMESWGVTVYYAAVSIGINTGSIRPKDWHGGTAKLEYGRAVGSYSAVTGKVIPHINNEYNISIILKLSSGGYAAITGKVFPRKSGSPPAVVNNKCRIGGYSATVGRVNPLL